MEWTQSNLSVMIFMGLVAIALVTLAEIVDRRGRSAFMYERDAHKDCRCKHRGYEHSYRTGTCRFSEIRYGLIWNCSCALFDDTGNAKES